ncbi:PLDc N-terminal domain-containing protein [Daejeonella lutea]|uniref:Phospholipase_D-nuclease N-terminal n=1 Tax=Daejeonella lutea TaxID=572036 RepID=A0A1T5DC95_9SPHI|nr:PLD nuclease N-terminal domain-containing protein [Daejeonella lutea]SKB69358.1 Phospholipase_D-nuclease N-terminal [Daejeonella lutea]
MENLLYLGLGGAEIILILVAGGIPLILTLYCLIDIMRSTFSDSVNKILWVIIVLLAPLIGSILYLVWGRSQKARLQS